jgi:hypothetical protein
VWAKKADFTTYDITYDAAGNVYTTGSFSGTVDFDPSPLGVFNITANTSSPNIFILKLNASGQFVWAKSFVPAIDDTVNWGSTIVVDLSGNVYTGGAFSTTFLSFEVGIVDFDPGPGVFNLNTDDFGLFAANSYLSKLDASGNFVWAIKMVSTSENGFSIGLDNTGNVYAASSFSGTKDFNPSALGVFNMTSEGSLDGYILKLNASGNFVWAKQIGGSDNDKIYGLTLDGTNNVLTSGSFRGTADFNPSTLGVYNLTSVDEDDAFISKLNSSGNFVWAKSISGMDYQTAENINVDEFGSVITTGRFGGTTDFDPSPGGVYNLSPIGGVANNFISKLDENGNFTWAKQFSGITMGPYLSLDVLGQIYFSGNYEDDFDCDPGPGTYMVTNAGGSDYFTLRLNADGIFDWAFKTGSTGQDFAQAIAVDASNNVYTTGKFSGSVDFNPGPSVFNLTGGNSFVTKLHQSIIPLPISLSLFTATCDDNEVLIEWTTVSETNNKDFTIERSIDGIHFSPLKSIEGYGNNLENRNYHFTDHHPLNGNNFYRLKQTDFDGNFSYSKVIKTHCRDDDNVFSVYPNPSIDGRINIILSNDAVVTVMNALGKTIYRQSFPLGQHVINLSTDSGMYFIKVLSGSHYQSQKIVIK